MCCHLLHGRFPKKSDSASRSSVWAIPKLLGNPHTLGSNVCPFPSSLIRFSFGTHASLKNIAAISGARIPIFPLTWSLPKPSLCASTIMPLCLSSSESASGYLLPSPFTIPFFVLITPFLDVSPLLSRFFSIFLLPRF